ncbi:hypothetical protein CMUS01_14705 [Colletotrichum musicola]|uniref:Uncharacterized protein n=1 Tax=Colletotrichum musicola TaxID=2175873 RepID=A0A8H6J298_9PEZI|nr:hypothetical protein CMUS01_14705 [Colletotrichum musicola]
MHYVYLADLIALLSSDNHDTLCRLIPASNMSFWKSFKSRWSYKPPPKYDLSTLTSTYPVCDDNLLFSRETRVVSLVWENEQIERTNFHVALY